MNNTSAKVESVQSSRLLSTALWLMLLLMTLSLIFYLIFAAGTDANLVLRYLRNLWQSPLHTYSYNPGQPTNNFPPIYAVMIGMGLGAIFAMERRRWRWAGFLVGMAALAGPEGWILVSIILAQSTNKRSVLIGAAFPTFINISAFLLGSRLLLAIPPTEPDWVALVQQPITLIVLAAVLLAVYALKVHASIPLNTLLAWGLLVTLVDWLLLNRVTFDLLVFAASVALCVMLVRLSHHQKTHYKRLALGAAASIVTVYILLLLGNRPNTSCEVLNPILSYLSQQVPETAVVGTDILNDCLFLGIRQPIALLHDQTVALANQRGDFSFGIIRDMPDFIFSDDMSAHWKTFDWFKTVYKPVVLTGVTDHTPGLWVSTRHPHQFLATHPFSGDFGPNLKLVGYALDTETLKATQPTRVRLDWQTYEMHSPYGIKISVLTPPDKVVTSASLTFEASIWPTNEFSTYAILVPDRDIPIQQYELAVSVSYPDQTILQLIGVIAVTQAN